MVKKLAIRKLIALLGCMAMPMVSVAQVAVPDSATDPTYKPNQPDTLPIPLEDQEVMPSSKPKRSVSSAPEHAKTIFLKLQDVKFEGVTAFNASTLAPLYAKYLGTNVSLDFAWKIAAELSDMYRKEGYFLSIAYVPAQQVKEGIILIKAVEGHIGIVQIQGSIGDNYVIRQHIEHLKSQHPIKSSELESFLLRIRDLEGVSYKGVLASVKEEVKELVEYRSAGAENGIEFDEVVEEGAVKLLLVPSVTKWRANISLDNYGSVYYNPHNLSVYAQNTILPLSQTSISGLLSLPMEQFQFAAIDHTVNVMRDVNLELHAEKQASEPGDILKKLAMTGQAEAYSAAIRYNPIRQRNMNMYIRASLESRNGQSKSLSFIANVDKMRAARLALTTDWIDSFSGFNSFNTRYTQGLAKLGASRMGSNTVRENTKPDFSKIDANLARLQGLTKEWFIYGALTGQYTKHIVFSSEEFGYGGRQFGRAFDSNDFKGFKGYAYSLELRYEGVPKIKNVALHPYSFFDAGELWSRVRLSSAIERKRASSAGLGIRFETWFNMNGNIGLALPVEQKIPKPIYSGSKNGPRVILSVSQSF